MSVGARAGLLGLGLVVAVGLVAAWCAAFLRTTPATVTAKTVETSAGPQAYITMQTVGSIGYGARPSWVSYLMQNQAGKWVHTTKFQVPANATVHVTVEEFDGVGPLRNPKWSGVIGTVGDVEHVQGDVGNNVDHGGGVSVIGPGDAAHSFAIPSLGVFVPLAGYAGNAPLCAVAPCTLKSPHDIDTFAFHTKGPGIYRWQCFVPCGLNYYDGNGGPMSTLGFMMGFMDVVS